MVTSETLAVEQTVRRALDAWNQHDLNALSTFYDADAAVHDPQYPQPLRGRDAIRKDAEEFVGAFPDLHMKLSNLVVKGENVGFEAVASGTHQGPLAGPEGSIPATNKRVEMRFAIFLSFSPQGLITEERRYYDQAGMAAQLGA